MPTNPSVIELSALNGAIGFRINGEAAGDVSGRSVAGAGDINGDGFADLIIGAIGAQPHGIFSGSSYVVFGKAGGFGSSLELSALDGSNGFQVNGEASGDLSGSVSSAGDINGDGLADVIIGAYEAGPNGDGSGASYVVFGKADGFASSLELSTLDGSDGFQINGEAAGDTSGHSVSSAGDVNGDGLADLIIGAEYADPNGDKSGASYVVFGKATGSFSLELSALDGSNGFQINGEAANDGSGRYVSSAGDVNGDGFADIIMVSYRANAGNYGQYGASYVVFGKAGGFASSLELSALDGSDGFQITGPATNDFTATSVSGAGDINGDGFDDIIIGAFGAKPHGDRSGASYVVFGKAGGFASNVELSALDGADGFRINGEAARDSAGGSVSSAGDFNGDGFADLIVGAAGADSGAGASYVVFGKAGGFASSLELSALDGTNGFQINGEAANDVSGFAVSGAGDINRDGFADLIIGAFDASPNGDNSGASYVIYGHATGTIDRSGSDGRDTLGGGDGDDTLSGLGGNDRLNGGSGDDLLIGGGGKDTVSGGGGDDILRGGSGNDRLDGGSGYDRIDGGSGNDTFIASAGHDTLHGGSGNDLLNIAAHFKNAATVDLAAGTAHFGGANSARLYDIENVSGTKAGDHLAGDGVANRLAGGGGKDIVAGAGGKDKLNGGAGSDRLNGGAGNDRLFGGNGDDTLIGAGGKDTLTGGHGRDLLTGGGGTDSFDFNSLADSAPGSQRDHIIDFAKGTERIDLAGIDAKQGVSGNQAFHVITGAFTGHKGELHSLNVGANSRVAGDVDGDKQADFSILVENVHNLHAVDFVL